MDDQIRLSAFEWLEQQSLIYGNILPRSILQKGFKFNSEYVTLVGPKGIWKPRQMTLPLSITTIADSPYDDSDEDDLLKYRYRGTNPQHPDNLGLRQLMLQKIPLVYFRNISKGEYLPAWPVFILDDDMRNLTFTVALDTTESLADSNTAGVAKDEALSYGRRSYLTATYRQRLHQSSFRLKVLRAYQHQCTLCSLKHSELLDAAHILEDKHELGHPIVPNGLSLCKIHHAAFDANIIGITPDYLVKVRDDILIEIDGPMLKHGLQSLNNNKIVLPNQRRNWPDAERLEMRYARFLSASA